MSFRPPTQLLLLLILALPVQAQEDAYFRHLTTEDGLNSSSVIALAVDREGFAWIGTSNGLNRHDGARMIAFFHDPADSTSIPDARVDAIFVASDGGVYIGTQNGAARFEPTTRTWRRIPFTAEERVVVHGFDELPDGTLSLATWQHGQILFDPASWTTRQGVQFTDRPDDVTLREYLISGADHAWVTRYLGLVRIRRSTGQIEMPDWPASTLQAFDRAVVFSMVEHGGRLWMASVDGVQSVDLDSGILTVHDTGPSRNHRYALELFVDSQDHLWVGTQGGLSKLDGATGRFVKFEASFNRTSSIFPGSVHAIAEDATGVLWVSSDERGVSMLDLYSRHARQIESRLYPSTRMPEGHSWAAAETRDGRIWVGMENTFGSWSRSEERFTVSKSPALQGTTVTRLALAGRDHLWVGTSNRGVCLFDTARDTCSPVVTDISSVYSLFPEEDGTLWIGTFGGLVHLNTETGARKLYRKDADDVRSLDSDLVMGIWRDPAGPLWVGTDAGLNRLNPVSDTFDRVLTSHPVFQIEPRHDGKFWLIGLDVSVFDPATSSVTGVAPFGNQATDGLAKSAVMEEDGRLWVNLTTSVALLDLDGRLLARFPVPEGRRSFQSAVTATLRTRDGTMVMGMEDGMILFDPKELVVNPFPPAPVFS